MSKGTLVFWANDRFYRRPGGRVVMENQLKRVPDYDTGGWQKSLTGNRRVRLFVNGSVVACGDRIEMRPGRHFPDVQHVIIRQTAIPSDAIWQSLITEDILPPLPGSASE
jgi:hypothetical protein